MAGPTASGRAGIRRLRRLCRVENRWRAAGDLGIAGVGAVRKHGGGREVEEGRARSLESPVYSLQAMTNTPAP